MNIILNISQLFSLPFIYGTQTSKPDRNQTVRTEQKKISGFINSLTNQLFTNETLMNLLTASKNEDKMGGTSYN